MKTSDRRSIVPTIGFTSLAFALLQSSTALAACAESGGTDICVGPEVGAYRYQVSDGFYVTVQGDDEAVTIEALAMESGESA